MKAVRCEIWEADLPFRARFKHSLHERESSDSIFVRLESDTGEEGWGESLPREYVTGETASTVVDTIQTELWPLIASRLIATWEEGLETIKNIEAEAREKNPDIPQRIGASRCAVELAFLDLAGNHFRRSVAEIFGSRKREWIEYSGVIGGDSPWKAAKSALKMRVGGLRYIKVKVGEKNDRERLKRIRTMVGKKTDLRLDANAGWSVSEAIAAIQTLKQFGVSCVEQPVAAGDYEGLQAITSAVTTPIMVDESLCTFADAKKIISMDACDFFNIRISKCGGLFASMELAEYARNQDKLCQLGCQVGESAILSAAGRHFALGIAGLRYVEGSYGTHLLEQDVARQNLTFGRRGIGRPLQGPGLGIEVLPERIEPHVRRRHLLGEAR